MKEEKELIWLIILANSDYVKRWLNKKPATKKDIERLVDAPMNSKEFHDWFDTMLEQNCIIEVAHESSNLYNKYMVNLKEIEVKISQNIYNRIVEDYYNRDRII